MNSFESSIDLARDYLLATSVAKPRIGITLINELPGRSIFDLLLKDDRFVVRGFTKDIQAQHFKELIIRGVDIVQCDLENKSQVTEAFKGCDVIVGVTNFWKFNEWEQFRIEEIQGKNIVDACVAANVKYFIWNSAANADKMSGGRLAVPLFTNKHLVEEYARSKEGLRCSFVYLGYFMQNFTQMLPFKVLPDGKLATLELALSPDTPLPLIDANDVGVIIWNMLLRSTQFKDKVIYCASEYKTINEITDEFRKVVRIPVEYLRRRYSTFKKHHGEALANMFEFIDEFGYFGKKELVDLETVKMLNPKLGDFSKFLAEHKDTFIPTIHPASNV